MVKIRIKPKVYLSGVQEKGLCRHPAKSVKSKTNFLSSEPKHTLWVLKRTDQNVSLNCRIRKLLQFRHNNSVNLDQWLCDNRTKSGL